jgi:di/tricarboxylate transporter
MMVHGPGGYCFGDYWQGGLVVMAWALLVTLVAVPLYWKF